MPKPKYLITDPEAPNPLKGPGGKGDSALVYTDADLKKRTDAADKAGHKVQVKKL